MKLLTSLLIVLVLTATAAAQTGAPRDLKFPVRGTVAKASTVFSIDDAGRTSIVILPAGTSVLLVGRSRSWYEIRFPSPQGTQRGQIAPFDVRLDLTTIVETDEGLTRALEHRGFVDGEVVAFPWVTPVDRARGLGESLVREEVFLRPAEWLQVAAGIDLNASSRNHVDDTWRLDWEDRGTLRPRLALRRLSGSVTSRHLTIDVGKQFIRWGRADILSPTDRFAPRDFLNVIDHEFLPVLGARVSLQASSETLEFVVVPRMTPSRIPVAGDRWAYMPDGTATFTVVDQGSVFPTTLQQGVRWSHSGRFEMGLSLFNGVNHLPDLNVAVDADAGVLTFSRTYPALRSVGGEASVPTSIVTLKGEAAYFTAPNAAGRSVLYVVEAERLVGEWILDVGYAGEIVIDPYPNLSFAMERGMAQSIIGKASYTVDPSRTVSVEAAVRQNGAGAFARAEYSQAFGQHVRVILAGVALGGRDGDFLGIYRRNSHVSARLRLSF